VSGLIGQLRDIVPIRALTLAESFRIAELQAQKMLEHYELTEPPVPESVIAQIPRIQIERLVPSPVSGATQWSRGRWLILLSGTEPMSRQRFSLAHEFKHVLDHPFIHLLYPPYLGMSEHDRAEQVCDHFAGCLLMPRPWIKRAWGGGAQDLGALAQQFDVSRAAIQVRLRRIGLLEPTQRCLVRS